MTHTDFNSGLTDGEVATRVTSGLVNEVSDPPTRSFTHILRTNAITPINAIMLVLFVLVLVSGHWRDGLFVGVVLSNTFLGVTQEVQARRELAKLQVLTAPKSTVVRNGQSMAIPSEQIVQDDIIMLIPGGEIPVDGTVLAGTGLQIDESMLTGESVAVAKVAGDDVLSGSFVVAGSGRMHATAVGDASYAASLAIEAKTFNAAESHLRQAVDRILSWLTILIPIASVVLLLRLLNVEDRWQEALQGTVAAAVAMVPDGLVLLTSLAFVAGVLELSRRKALAKQLSTVEVLARVDVLCLDKTGTITTGNIVFEALHPLGGATEDQAREALAALAGADDAPNATMAAIALAVAATSPWEAIAHEPFSSARKWSAVEFADQGWWYMGAPDVLLDQTDGGALVDELSSAGQRLIALAASAEAPVGDVAPKDLQGVAIIELRDEIRSDAADILAYFADQDVTVKVISGDSPDTVAAIAERAGLRRAGSPVDARTFLEDSEGLAQALVSNDVFGRVAPRQKQDMVHALQALGHVVAMTGDGVNDVLALKDADLGIAMGSGSAASQAVADLVLTDDSFSTLPIVVNEGRKVINNVERVANLFVTKAVYAVIITICIAVIGSPFPFLPRQLTLIGTFSIGVPGFFLALSPEVSRVRSGFLSRVLRFSVPAGIAAGAATIAAYEIAHRTRGLTIDEARTLATVTLLGVGLAVLIVASRPLRPWKLLLAAAMATMYGVIFAVPFARRFFQLVPIGLEGWTVVAVCVVAGSLGVTAVGRTISARASR